MICTWTWVWVNLHFIKAKKKMLKFLLNRLLFMNVNYVKVYSDHLPVSFKKKPLKHSYI